MKPDNMMIRGKSRNVLTTMLAAAVMSLLAANIPARAADAVSPLSSLVGDDVGLCVEFRDLEKNLKGFLKSEMYRRLSSTEVFKAWRGGAEFRQLNTAIGHVEQLTGKRAGTLAADLFGQSVLLAAYSNGKQEPTGVFLTQTRSTAVLDATLQAWRRAAPKDVIVELKHQGQRYYRRTASKNDGNGSNSKDSGRPVYYVKLDAVFALSDNENAIRDVIARSQSADGKSLARSKRYLQARQSLTGTPVVTLYFNPRQWDDSMEFRKNDGPASALLQQFWKQCNSVVVGVRLDGGCVTEVVADFDPDGLPAAWTRLAAQTAGAADFLSRIPREAVLAVAGRYDPNLILAAIRLNQKGEDDKHWKAFQRYARVFLLGVDLSTELVPSLRTNGGLYVVPRATSNKAVFPFDGLAAVEIVEATGNADNAADEFRAKLDRGLANGATVLATFYNLSQAKKGNTAEQGLALVQSAKRHGTRIRWVDGIGEYRPAVALTKKYLVVASSPELIEDFVAPAKKNRLQSTTVFQRWKQRYFPNENQLVYVNIRGLHDHIRSVRPVLVGWLSGGRSASRQPAGKRLDRALDLLQVIDGAFAAAQISKSEVRLVFGGVVKPTDSARDSKP